MRSLKLLLVCALSLVLAGCPDWIGIDARDARIASNAAAMTLEAMQSTAELLYFVEQKAVVEAAKAQPGMTQEELAKRVEAIRAKWKPLKELFPKARAVQSKLAAALKVDTVGATLEALALVAQLTALQEQIASGVAEARARMEGG